MYLHEVCVYLPGVRVYLRVWVHVYLRGGVCVPAWGAGTAGTDPMRAALCGVHVYLWGVRAYLCECVCTCLSACVPVWGAATACTGRGQAGRCPCPAARAPSAPGPACPCRAGPWRGRYLDAKGGERK